MLEYICFRICLNFHGYFCLFILHSKENVRAFEKEKKITKIVKEQEIQT